MFRDTTWRRLFELLNDVARQEDTEAMLDALYKDLADVVPADQGVAMFEMRNGVPHCLKWPEYSGPLVPAFNERFNGLCPAAYDWDTHSLGPVAWKSYLDTEYDRDFNLPLRIGHSVGIGFPDPLRRRELIVCLHRSRECAPFPEDSVRILVDARQLLARIYAIARDSEAKELERLSPLETVPGATVLSRREAEVARFLSRRMTMREIAEILGISRRTVERHALHIYQKLGIAGRKELLRSSSPSPSR